MDYDDSFEQPTLYTVEQLSRAEPALTIGGIRFDLSQRKQNGLEKAGAVFYRGRKILIHRERYFDWLAGNSNRSAA